MNNIDENTKFKFNGNVFNLETFKKNILKEEEKPYAVEIINNLIDKGTITLIEIKDDNRKAFEDAIAESTIVQLANTQESEEEERKDAEREFKNKDKLTYKRIKLPFNSVQEAQKFKVYVESELRIKDNKIEYEAPIFLLIIHNVTEDELKAIKKYYGAEKLIKKTVDIAEKNIKKVTDGINYTAKNVVNPITTIGFKSLGSIFSTMAGVVGHAGASLVTSTSSGIKKTKKEILEDPETLKATRDLIKAKDSIKKKISGGLVSGSGITIEND